MTWPKQQCYSLSSFFFTFACLQWTHYAAVVAFEASIECADCRNSDASKGNYHCMVSPSHGNATFNNMHDNDMLVNKIFRELMN